MKEQFVTYKIALKLKELGFNTECFAYFTGEFYEIPKLQYDSFVLSEKVAIKNNSISQLNGAIILAPLWQQVIDWLREKYNINIVFTKSIHTNCWIYTLEGIDNGKNYYELFRSYAIAREKAILKALELCKNN